MANKRIVELPSATSVLNNDAFVLSQTAITKQVSGSILKNFFSVGILANSILLDKAFTINFTGTGASVSNIGTDITVNIPGGYISSVNGHTGASVTVTKADVGLSSVVNADTTTTSNITDSTNKRFVSDSQLVVLGNTSGTNTGDETTATIKSKLGLAGASNDGYISSSDWNSFNNKENVSNKATNFTTPDNTTYPTTLAVQDALDLKLNIADYNNYYRGTYVSLLALQTAVSTGNPGDYAIVDAGVSSDASIYIWDDSDADWKLSSGTGGPSTTDALAEGSTNLYFTNGRAITAGATAFVRHDVSQSLSGGEQSQARTNIGLGDVSTHSYSEFEIVSNKVTDFSSPDNTTYPTTQAVQDELDLKLNIADYNNYYRGTYVSLVALQTAIPTGNPGDYAIVDTGTSSDAVMYIWDDSDADWKLSAGTGGPSTTDALAEGSTNLYFTNSRAITSGATAFVRYDASQSLSGGEQSQARTNIGLGSVAIHDYSEFEIVSNKVTDFSSPDNTTYPTTQAVQDELDLKLNIADYNNYYRGTYVSLLALQTAVPTANPGDYAIVDAGVSNDSTIYIWDDSDSSWVESAGTGGPSSTDSLAEGSTNLYFTNSRAITSGATAFVRYDASQSLSGGEQSQARTNIGLGDVSTHSYSEFEIVSNKVTNFTTPDNTTYPTTQAVQDELDLKLNIADYNNYYRGTYTTLLALQTAIPTGNPGDYAIVDVASTDSLLYIWDDSDSSWVESANTGSGPSTTDALTEGSTNLYFTNGRAITAGATAFVRYDASQSLSSGEKLQARTNIGLGDVSTHAYSEFEIVSNKATNLTLPDNTKYPTTLAVKNALDLKLDASSYNNYYRGTYVSLVALQTAIPTGNPGDYAIVDTGTSSDAVMYIWDNDDTDWVPSASTGGPSTTDALAEGSTNLYFTNGRAVTAGAAAFVRYDASQSLSGGQQTQARSNIGLGTMATENASNYTTNANSVYQFNDQSGTSYLIQSSDLIAFGRMLVTVTNASAISVTIDTPTSYGVSVGASVTVIQGGAGTITITATGSATLSSAAVFTGVNKAMTLVATSTTNWRVIGV